MDVPNLCNNYCLLSVLTNLINMQQAPIIYLALGRKQEEFAVLDTKTYYKATPLIKTG